MEIKAWFHNYSELFLYIIGICIFLFGFFYNFWILLVLALIIISIGIAIAGKILKKRYIFIFLTFIAIYFYFIIKIIINKITIEVKSEGVESPSNGLLGPWDFLIVVCIVIIVGIITLIGSRILVYKEKMEYNRSLMKLIKLHKIDPDKAFKLIEKMSESAAKEGYQLNMELSKITKKVTSSLKNTNKK